MMHFSEPIPISSASDAPADRMLLAAAAYLGRFKGSSRDHTESDLRCYLDLVRGARPGSAGRPPPASGAVHPVDAGSPPVQALNGVAAVLGRRRVLPDLRDRRGAGAFTGRACPPPVSPTGVADPGIHPPAVRGPADRRPRVGEPV